MTRIVLALMAVICAMVLAAPASAQTVNVQNNWTCRDLNGAHFDLVKVTQAPGATVDAINFRNCDNVDIDRVELLIYGADGLKFNVGTTNINIDGGYVAFRGASAGAHQDGIQTTCNGTGDAGEPPCADGMGSVIRNVVFSGMDSQGMIIKGNVLCDGCKFIDEHPGLYPQHLAVNGGPAQQLLDTNTALTPGGTLNTIICDAERFGRATITLDSTIGWNAGQDNPEPGSGNVILPSNDPVCQDDGWPNNDPPPPPPAPQCSDGVNNDPVEDTLVDFPSDPGCLSATDDSELGNPPPPDTDPPETSFAGALPANSESTSASFSFMSDEPGTFECALDAATFAACTSPRSYSSLAVGSHTFRVRATDGAGNVDASPAAHTWSVLAPPPPPPSGTTINRVDSDWRCNQTIASLATNGLPLRVNLTFTRQYVDAAPYGLVQFGPSCVGDNNRATVDVILNVQGTATVGGSDDAVRIQNALPGARNLVISGRVNCGPAGGGAHQDGVQILGGTNILFRDFHVGDAASGFSTCGGQGGAMYYDMQSNNIDIEGGSYIACNHSIFADERSDGATITGVFSRSGRTDGSDPKCRGLYASNPCIDSFNGSFIPPYTCERWVGGQWVSRGVTTN